MGVVRCFAKALAWRGTSGWQPAPKHKEHHLQRHGRCTKSSTNANNVEVYSQKRGWVPLKSLPDKPQSPRKLPAKTVHRRPRKAAPPSPSRATTSALVQLGTTLQALGAQLVNSVVDCAV